MGGLYDILESYRQQNDPRFIYEGLYEEPAFTGINLDPMYDIGARQFGNMQRNNFGIPQQTGIMQQAPALLNLSDLPANMGVANEEDVEEDVEGARRTGGLADLFRAALSFAIPGFSFLENIGGQPYQQFSPGTTIRNGIVNVAGVNTPYSMFGGDFYNPNTGLNRFDRAAQRFTKTGSMLDLFGSSRTGKEFFEKRRQIQAQKQKDLEEAAKAKIKFKQDTGGGGAGFGGSRRGDADISDSQRGGFATDDTAGFF